MFHETLQAILSAGASLAFIVLPSAPLLLRSRPSSIAVNHIGHGVEARRGPAKLQ
jgi:hypothetical protein